jgi:hypothetical protein
MKKTKKTTTSEKDTHERVACHVVCSSLLLSHAFFRRQEIKSMEKTMVGSI